MVKEFVHQTVTPSEGLPFRFLIHSDKANIVIRHWHQTFEISYTVSGHLHDFYIDGCYHNTDPGDILLISSYAIHGINVPDKAGHVALTLVFPLDFCHANNIDIENYEFAFPKKGIFTATQQKSYQQLQKDFYDLFLYGKDNDDHQNDLKINSLVFDILYLLIRDFSRFNENRARTLMGDAFRYMNEVLTYLRANYQRKITLEDIACELHLSSGYLSKLFRETMGETIIDYLTELRVQEAVRLLLNTTDSIDVITESAGFPNKKSFIAAFKKQYHQPPYQYKKEYLNLHA